MHSYSVFTRVKWMNENKKTTQWNTDNRGGLNGTTDEKCDCGNSGYTVSHHSSTALRQHKAARRAATGSSRKASSTTTARKHYLGLHSQPSNTALWGTQQTGLAFRAQAAALRDNWLTMQSSRTNTMEFTEVWQGRWRFRLHGTLLFQVCPPPPQPPEVCILWISIQCLLKKYHYLKE